MRSKKLLVLLCIICLVSLLTLSIYLSGCSANNTPEDEDPKELSNISDSQQETTNTDAITLLLNALQGATDTETDSLEEQFFRYYDAHNHELTMMPAFEKGHLPNWDDLTLFVLLNNDNRLTIDGSQALTADTFSQIVLRFFGKLEYQDESSKYLTFKDDAYTAVPGDTMRNGYFRLKQITTDGNEYTAAFDAFFFTDPDFTEEYEKATPNQRAVRDRAQTKDFLQPGDFANAILEIFMESDYASVLDVSETIIITFSLSGDSAYPFIYLSCEIQ